MVGVNKLNIYTVLKVIFLLFVVAIIIIPFLNMIAVSFSKDIYVMKNEVGIIPKGFSLETYKIVLQDPRISRAYYNTIVYVIVGTLISLSVTAMGAFCLSRKNMLFQRTFSISIIITMFFSGGMIPTYLTVKSMGMVNNIWGVVLPGAVSAWYLIIMRTFFCNIPKELEEAGKMDGLRDPGVFWYIVLPLSKAALATIGLFYAVGLWNAFFGPFLYLTDENKYPLQVLLRQIIVASDYKSNEATGIGGDSLIMPEALKFATIMVSTLPIMLVYPFIQKYFVQGVMIGSVKG